MSAPSGVVDLRFSVDDAWAHVPPEYAHLDVAGVDVDADDTVYLLTRERDGVVVLERDGTFRAAWGDGVFTIPHGLTVATDGSVYCVDNGDHTVRRFTPTGELLMTLGSPGTAADTGYRRGASFVVHGTETIDRPAGPFNGCTNLAVAPSGDLYIADGYGNCRIHRFTAEGELVASWGGIGIGPGQFHLPHGIAVTADERVLVADRENERIQVFDPHGRYLTEWTDVQRPTDLALGRDGLVYVSELWRPRGTATFTRGITPHDLPGRVTVLEPEAGGVVARWGASTVMRDAPGNFVAPHALTVDSTGAVYVGEVTGTFGVRTKRVPASAAGHQLQKFTPIS